MLWTSNCLQKLGHPADSIWKMPIVSPRLRARKSPRHPAESVLSEKSGHALPDQRHRVLDHCQRFQAQEIHLEQAEIVQRPHRILADDFVSFGVAAERHVFGQIAIADDDAGRVHAGVARKSFQHGRVIPQLPRRRFRLDRASSVPDFLGRGLRA